jgi:NADPH:quinone reductase-like Zn-dependent oxidoreductase
MQAIVQDKYGSSSALQLRSIAKPKIGVDDMLIRVRAAGLHVGDVRVMRASLT